MTISCGCVLIQRHLFNCNDHQFETEVQVLYSGNTLRYQALVFVKSFTARHSCSIRHDISAVSLLPQPSFLFWVSLPHEVPTIFSVIRPFAQTTNQYVSAHPLVLWVETPFRYLTKLPVTSFERPCAYLFTVTRTRVRKQCVVCVRFILRMVLIRLWK